MLLVPSASSNHATAVYKNNGKTKLYMNVDANGYKATIRTSTAKFKEVIYASGFEELQRKVVAAGYKLAD